MRDIPDVVELAQHLVRHNTVGGGNERPVLEELATLLRGAGFTCSIETYSATDADRANLYARLNPGASGRALFFGGHLDTVPFGDAPWTRDPLGVIAEDRLYGRGSCDMKSGLAAMICAALTLAPRLAGGDLVLHIYGGEETGCLGSFHAARRPECFGRPGAGIIAEPTGNRPFAGHKGALWLAFETVGRTAHGSMPDEGVNALTALLPVAARLLEPVGQAEHFVLGKSTIALTSLHSGLNVNSIPDKAVLTVDMRTVPGQDHGQLLRKFREVAGEGVSLRTLLDVPPLWTDPDIPWCVDTRRLLAEFLGEEPGVESVAYFTDAAAARAAFPELPLLILGPGDPAMAHKTDEYCQITQIRAAQAIYEALIRAWYRLDADG